MNTPYFVLAKTNMLFINTNTGMIPVSFCWIRDNSKLSAMQISIIKDWAKDLGITKIHDLNTNEVLNLDEID